MRVFEFVARAVDRRPHRILWILLLSLGPAAWLSSELRLETSFLELLPASHPAVENLRRGLGQMGGSAFSAVAVGLRDESAAKRFARELEAKLNGLERVRYAEARLDLDFILARRLLYLTRDQLVALRDEVKNEIDRRTLEFVGLGIDLDESSTQAADLDDLERRFSEKLDLTTIPFREFNIGSDHKYLYVFVSLRGDAGDLAFARTAQAAVEETAYALRAHGGFPPDLELRFTGSLVNRLEEDGIMRRDLSLASAVGFSSVVVLLVAFTQRKRTLVLVSAPLFVGLMWTLAFATIVVGRLNIVSGFLVSILSGLGIEYSIHLLLRYLEERKRGLAPKDATARSIVKSGRPLLGSAATNAGVFFVIALAQFEGFREFGLILGAGILITFGVTVFGFPALCAVIDRRRPMAVTPLADEARALSEFRIHPGIRFVVMVVMAAFVVVAIHQLANGKVRYRTNWREMKGKSPASDFDDYMIQSLGESFTQSLVLTSTPSDIDAVVKSIERVNDARKESGLPFGITRVTSVLDLVPRDQAEKLSIIADLRRELDRVRLDELDPDAKEQWKRALELTELQPFSLADVPRSLKQRFLANNATGSVVALSTNYMFYESDELMSWADQMDEIRAELDRRGLSGPIVSENWVAGSVFRIIVHDGPTILAATFMIVFLILLFDFRNIAHATIVLLALSFGQLSIAGVMGLLGLELNFLNSAILPIVVGVSIDNAVHIYHRYIDEGPSAIPKIMRYTVPATGLSSATNLLGFGSMIVAHHYGLRSAGWLAVIGIALTFFSTSVFFPIALLQFGEKRPRRKEEQTNVA